MKYSKNLPKNIKMNWDKIKTVAQFDGETSCDYSASPPTLNDCDDKSHKRFDVENLCDNASKPSPSTSLLIESLIQLICRILEDNPKVAFSSYQAICEQLHKINLIGDSYLTNEFEDIRSQYQMQIYKIICAVSGRDIPISLPSVESKGQTVETCWSRYHREFEEIGFIAGGGFGKVFRARHKLDCIEYAVKQIKINTTKIKLCHLAEVKTIAKLNHPNIVQYKAAWLEPYLPNDNAIKMVKSGSNTVTDQESTRTPTDMMSSSSISASNVTSNKSSDFIQFERSENDPEPSEMPSETGNSKKICKYYDDNNSLDVFRPKPKLAILYIQMSLCQLTLRKWLNDRNACPNFVDYYIRFFGQESDLCHVDIVNDIFSQILSGLNYIHSKNIVHHDIKPSNIFLGKENDGKLIVQLGDFGLSCPLQNDGRNIPRETSFQSDHRNTALGTPLYAAPEQLKGQCTPKSDIYSLGIVLIELLLKFDTDMERVCTIEKARKGTLPSELNRHSMKLLKSLLSHVKVRPTTKDLLEAIRLINLEQNLRALKASQSDSKLKDVKIRNLNKEIHTLTEKTASHQLEISKLLMELEKKDRQVKELTALLERRNVRIFKLKRLLRRFRPKKID